MPERWPAILTPELMREYLSVKSSTTLASRVRMLGDYGLPPKDRELGGWWREEVDAAIARKRGVVSPSDEISRGIEEWARSLASRLSRDP